MRLPWRFETLSDFHCQSLAIEKLSHIKSHNSPQDFPSATTSLIVTIHPLHSGLRGEDTVQASGKSLPSRLTGGEGGLSPTNFMTQPTEFILTSVLWILNNGGRIYLDLRFWATWNKTKDLSGPSPLVKIYIENNRSHYRSHLIDYWVYIFSWYDLLPKCSKDCDCWWLFFDFYFHLKRRLIW